MTLRDEKREELFLTGQEMELRLLRCFDSEQVCTCLERQLTRKNFHDFKGIGKAYELRKERTTSVEEKSNSENIGSRA